MEEQTRLGVEKAVFSLHREDGGVLGFSRQCSVWRWGGSETRLTTDSSGRLVLCGLESGSYQLVQEGAPGLYRTLRSPVQLTLDDDGTLQVEGRACAVVSILHRSGQEVAARVALAICSVLPAAVRLGLLWYKKHSDQRRFA